jgi:uncharacterized membrane protein
VAAIGPVLPVFCSYALSFAYLGIYWNNHHHMLHLVDRVTGHTLWANLHLLFWLSLFPFITGWIGESHLAPFPTAVYGGVMLMAAVAWLILQTVIVAQQGTGSRLAAALGSDAKGKISAAGYLAAVIAAFFAPWVSAALYVFVALMWLVPDRRMERMERA